MQERILVTGGAGFIGSHLVDGLIERGTNPENILIIDNLSTGKSVNIHPKCKFANGDLAIMNYITLSQILRDLDINTVYHLASLSRVQPSYTNPHRWITNNVNSTQNVLEACRLSGVRKIIYASSSTVTYRHPSSIDESPYTLSKYISETICNHYRRNFDMNVCNLRYYSVYGDRMDLSESNSTLFARIFKSLILDVPFKLYGDGTHARDFTHVDDIVSGTILAMEHIEKCKRNHYELGTSKSYSIRDILKMVPQLKIDHLPSVSEVSITRANTANAELEFNYTPERNIELWLVNQLNNLDYWKSRLLLYEN